jgi:hypothetical protein
LTRSRIEEEVGCVEAALATVKHALRVWREMHEVETQMNPAHAETETNRGTGDWKAL